MIAAWMLTLLLLGAVLLAAAHGGDAMCARLGWPRRWVWAGATVAMCLVPTLPKPELSRHTARASVALAPAVPPGTPAATGGATPVRRAGTFVEDEPQFVISDASLLPRFDRLLLVSWASLSVLAITLVVGSLQRLQRARRGWTPADAAMRSEVSRAAGCAVAVWRSSDAGPAAFGLHTPQVVVPAWVDALLPQERTLLLAHEAMHVRARDPHLIAAGLGLAVLLPWHLPLLVAYRRLCRAVEQDCDARVLARHRDAQGYGRLLVRTAEWRLTQRETWRGARWSRWLLAPVPAFAAPVSELESRLRALVRRRPSWRGRVAAATAGLGALLLLVAACTIPAPTRGTPARSSARVAGAGVQSPRSTTASPELPPWFRTVGRMMLDERFFSSAEFDRAVNTGLRENIRRYLPAVLEQDQPSDRYVWLVLGPTGSAIHYALGREGLAVGSRDSLPDDSVRFATPDTPHDQLTLRSESWRRRFPDLGTEPISFGWHTLRVGGRNVNVYWALTDLSLVAQAEAAAGGASPSASDGADAATRMAPSSRDAIEAARNREIEAQLRAAVQAARPDLLRGRRTNEEFVWLVLDSAMRVIAADTGRAGMAREVGGWRALLGSPRATDRTPRDSLVLDPSAFRAKFGGRIRPSRATAWQGITLVNGYVNVLWTIASTD